MEAKFTAEQHKCCMCGEFISIQCATTPHPEAPEMMQPPSGAWMGLIEDKDGGPLVIFACSDACLVTLLEE